jgi:hypothetical protein
MIQAHFTSVVTCDMDYKMLDGELFPACSQNPQRQAGRQAGREDGGRRHQQAAAALEGVAVAAVRVRF